MKKRLIPYLVALVLTAAGTTASAQSPAQGADSVLLSEQRDGDYLVRRYLIKAQDDADYSIRYHINSAQLNAKLHDNDSELSGLGELIDGLLADTLSHVARVEITGYASPDGPLQLNRTLAERRMQDFKNYLDRRYDFSHKYKVKSSSEVVPWSDLRRTVATSAIPDRQRVLEILDGSASPAEKQAALKRMPAVWSYLAKNILPPLRRVALQIDYGQGEIVEQRVRVVKPAPEVVIVAVEEPCDPCATDPCCGDLLQTVGVIVAMPDNAVDF